RDPAVVLGGRAGRLGQPGRGHRPGGGRRLSGPGRRPGAGRRVREPGRLAGRAGDGGRTRALWRSVGPDPGPAAENQAPGGQRNGSCPTGRITISLTSTAAGWPTAYITAPATSAGSSFGSAFRPGPAGPAAVRPGWIRVGR